MITAAAIGALRLVGDVAGLDGLTAAFVGALDTVVRRALVAAAAALGFAAAFGFAAGALGLSAGLAARFAPPGLAFD